MDNKRDGEVGDRQEGGMKWTEGGGGGRGRQKKNPNLNMGIAKNPSTFKF
jgi:hypothetical protein